MVILSIPDPQLPSSLGWTHDGTDWALYKKVGLNEEDIVFKSPADTVNLTTIVVDVDLDPEITYYARARVIANKSIFDYSNVAIFKVPDYLEVTFNKPIPSTVMNPVISLSHDFNNVPPTLFTINVSDMSTTSNSTYDSVSYIIETLDGELVYTDTYNKDDLKYKLIDDVILKENNIYILKVIQHSSSNDSSDFSSTILRVASVDAIVLKTDIDGYLDKDYLPINIAPIENYKSMEVSVYAVGFGDGELIHTGSSTELTYVIPSEDMTKLDVDSFIISIEVTYLNNEKTGKKFYTLRAS